MAGGDRLKSLSGCVHSIASLQQWTNHSVDYTEHSIVNLSITNIKIRIPWIKLNGFFPSRGSLIKPAQHSFCCNIGYRTVRECHMLEKLHELKLKKKFSYHTDRQTGTTQRAMTVEIWSIATLSTWQGLNDLSLRSLNVIETATNLFLLVVLSNDNFRDVTALQRTWLPTTLKCPSVLKRQLTLHAISTFWFMYKLNTIVKFIEVCELNSFQTATVDFKVIQGHCYWKKENYKNEAV